MGLLDDALNDPMMSLGTGMMAASGPSRMPVRLGQVLAGGIQNAQQQSLMNRQMQMKEQMQAAQMQQMQQHAELYRQQAMERQQKMQALAEMIGKLPPEMQALAKAYPEQVASMLFKQPKEPQLVDVEGPDGRTVKKWLRPGEADGVTVGGAPNKEGALPWYVRKGPDGRIAIDPAYADFEKAKAASGRPATPYFQFIPTPQGIVTGDARSGKLSLGQMNGAPVMKSSDSPELQGKIAEEKKLGQEMGEQRSMLQGKQDALDSVREASKMLDSGIYSGAYAEFKMKGAKLMPGVNTDTAARTERFRSYIGNTVIPRLKEFGGNDSNEELRYLQKVMGGEITMENDALKKILEDTERKILRGVNNLKMRPNNQVTPTSPAPTRQGDAKFLGFE